MKKLILGVVLFAVGFMSPLLLVVSLLGSLTEETVALEAPGEIEVTVEEPGRYYVWNEYRTVYEGRTYSQSETLPSGIAFSLTEAESGTELPLSTDMSMSWSGGDRKKTSVGYFGIEEPGDYVLSVQGPEEPRVFSFGPSLFGDLPAFLGRMILGAVLALAGVIGGVLLVIFGILELVRKDRNPQPPPKPSGMPR